MVDMGAYEIFRALECFDKFFVVVSHVCLRKT